MTLCQEYFLQLWDKQPPHTIIPGLYPKSPITIQEIEFTPRQWDIVAAFYHLKKVQMVGTLLGITNDGVQAHIYNIKQKLPVKRKDVVHFLDTCHTHIRESLQRHYRYLLVEKAFQDMLKSLKLKGMSFEWNQDAKVPEGFPLEFINNHLLSSGCVPSHKGVDPDIVLNYDPKFSDPETYYTALVQLLEEALSDEKHQSLLKEFLTQQTDILSGTSAISENRSSAGVSILEQDKIEFSSMGWLECVKIFLNSPEYKIHRYVGGLILSLLVALLTKFFLQNIPPTSQKHQQIRGDGNVMIQGDRNKVSNHHQSSDIQAHGIQKIEQHFHSQGSLSNQTFQPVRSSLVIPAEKAFLKRGNWIQKLDEQLNAEKRESMIPLAGITGIGGAGKTTLSRYYGRLQKKASIVWELNAESKDSLINSFWGLAYALAQTPEQHQKLDSLQQVRNSNLKETLLIQFVKQSLKSHEEWLLIYDNLEDMEALQNCFPQDPIDWGRGRIIITSRNSNLKNIPYIQSSDILRVLI